MKIAELPRNAYVYILYILYVIYFIDFFDIITQPLYQTKKILQYSLRKYTISLNYHLTNINDNLLLQRANFDNLQYLFSLLIK